MSGIAIPGSPTSDKLRCSSSLAACLRSSHFSDALVSRGILVRLVDLSMTATGWFKVPQFGVILSIVLDGSYESSFFSHNDSDVRPNSFRIYTLHASTNQLITFRAPSKVRVLQLALHPDVFASLAGEFGHDGSKLLHFSEQACRTRNRFCVVNQSLPGEMRFAAEEAFLAAGTRPSNRMRLYSKAIEILSHAYDWLLSSDATIDDSEGRRLDDIRSFIEMRFPDPIAVQSLASTARLSERQFTARFRARFGISPVECLARARMREARQLLENSHSTVSEIAHRVGFLNHAAFTRAFRRHFGQPPSAFLDRDA